jgi:hypothetical protein
MAEGAFDVFCTGLNAHSIFAGKIRREVERWT